MAHAKKLGASDVGAEASEGSGLSVSVRKGELETVERNRDKSLGVTVYLGQRRGNASTSDFSRAAIEQTVQAAYDIARFTAADPVAGLPDEADIAQPKEQRDLDLFHPWPITSEQAAEMALVCEAAAFDVDKRIANSEGAGVSAQQSHFFSAHTHGFRGGYASSRHSISVAPIAGKGNGMQRDYWYSSERNACDLAAPEAVGRYAAERALSRLKSRKIATRECPVLFESPLAQVHRHAERLVAVALHRLHRALAHADTEARAFGRLGAHVAGAQLLGVRHGGVDQLFEECARIRKARLGLGVILHGDGYSRRRLAPWRCPSQAVAFAPRLTGKIGPQRTPEKRGQLQK